MDRRIEKTAAKQIYKLAKKLKDLLRNTEKQIVS